LYFQKLFEENHSNVIEYNGDIYYRFWPILINDIISFKLRFVHSDSKFRQAIVLSFPNNFDGCVSVMGNIISMKKTAFPMLSFWEDTSPTEFDVTITGFQGEIKLCNGSDPIGTKQFCKYLSEGCAMIARRRNDSQYCFYCNDHEYHNACNNLIFELEVLT